MPNLPIRNLGQVGVVTDVNPYDLPINGISKGNNVRFKDGSIMRSNVFRSVLNTTTSTPVFTFAIRQTGDFDRIGIADRNGNIYTYRNEVETNVTPSSWTASTADNPHTYAYLQNLAYLNRPDHVPWYFTATSSTFLALPNWDSTWRCASLRAYKDYLVALNVTKGTTEYPTMVKWSDIAQLNSYPASWDATDPTVSAGENVIGDMKTPILDGAALRDVFIVYSSDQIWLMEETSDQDVFRFRKLFDNLGVINQNSVVEVEGKHYVFGRNDIYIHDGSSFQSIVNGVVRNYIFNNLNYKKTSRCFVTHNPVFKEIVFAYVSGDTDAGFVDTDYANRGAIFNYGSNTWSFVDLPNVGMMTLANFSSSRTYTNVSSQWEAVGGTWYNQDAAGRDVIFSVSPIQTSAGLTASRLYGYEPSSNGVLPFPVNTEATKQAFVERVGIDLDELQAELKSYKVIQALYPQIKTQNEDQSVLFEFSGGTTPLAPMTFNTSVSFNPTTNYKVDTREGGRYLGWRMTSDDYYDFELSGFDASVVSTGRR